MGTLEVRISNDLRYFDPLGICIIDSKYQQTFKDFYDRVIDYHSQNPFNVRANNCQKMSSAILAWAANARDTLGKSTTPWDCYRSEEQLFKREEEDIGRRLSPQEKQEFRRGMSHFGTR